MASKQMQELVRLIDRDRDFAVNLFDKLITQKEAFTVLEYLPEDWTYESLTIGMEPTIVNTEKIVIKTIKQRAFTVGYILLKYSDIITEKVVKSVEQIHKAKIEELKEYLDIVEADYEEDLKEINQLWDESELV